MLICCLFGLGWLVHWPAGLLYASSLSCWLELLLSSLYCAMGVDVLRHKYGITHKVRVRHRNRWVWGASVPWGPLFASVVMADTYGQWLVAVKGWDGDSLQVTRYKLRGGNYTEDDGVQRPFGGPTD